MLIHRRLKVIKIGEELINSGAVALGVFMSRG